VCENVLHACDTVHDQLSCLDAGDNVPKGMMDAAEWASTHHSTAATLGLRVDRRVFGDLGPSVVAVHTNRREVPHPHDTLLARSVRNSFGQNLRGLHGTSATNITRMF
jgi:hypothetical protein